MTKRLLVVGSANIDFRIETSCIPRAGETLISDGKYVLTPGGKGANSAMAAARLGDTEVALCARLGDDNYGEQLRRYFTLNGINSRYIVTDKVEQTGSAFVLVENDGTNRIIVFKGANKRLCAADVDEAFKCSPDGVLVQFEGGPDAVAATALRAHKSGIPLFVDAGAVTRNWNMATIPECEIFSPNETETEILTGVRPASPSDCLKASISLCNRINIKYVVLKLGSRGCFVYDGKYCDLVSSYDVDEIDTTAAGDAFTAAIAAEYMRTGDIIHSARYANAVGALTVTRKGAIASLPTGDEVKAFLNGR